MIFDFQSEYDDEKVDPHYDSKKPEEEAPDDLDLPDDLNLDDKEAGEEEAGKEEEESAQGKLFLR